MAKDKVIKFRDRGYGNKEKVLKAVHEFIRYMENDQINDVCIVWRRIEEDNKKQYWLTDFIWHVREDKLALIGLLEYMKNKILENFKINDK